MKSNISNFCCVLKRLKWKKYISIILCVVILNSLISVTTGFNIIKSGTKKVLDSLGIYTEQVKEVVIKSDGYDEEEPGSWKITKKAEWTGTDTVNVTMDLETIPKLKDINKDILFVDVLGRHSDETKNKINEYIEYLFINNENNIGFISDSSGIINFTNDKEIIKNTVQNISLMNSGRNYTSAIINIQKVLDSYVFSDERELNVLFITDGKPTTDNPNQIAEYQILKDKYPDINIIAIQYNCEDEQLGKIDEIEKISDKQYIATEVDFKDKLVEASDLTETYEKLNITDYISDYFTIENITSNSGNTEYNSKKVLWNMKENPYNTGKQSSLNMELKLKEQYLDKTGFYNIEDKTEVNYMLNNSEKTKSYNDILILKNYYKVTYDINSPLSCNLKEITTENQIMYKNVEKRKYISSNCPGYVFKRWEIAETDVKQLSTDKFEMPQHDVTIRATWTKVSISKTMDGTVHKGTKLIDRIKNDVNNGENGALTYTGEETVDYEKPIYYYTSSTNNNVLFANFCWQIIRTTETGGIKLIYNGEPSETGTCENTGAKQTIGNSLFYSNATNDYTVASTGYMYDKKATSFKSSFNYFSNLDSNSSSGSPFHHVLDYRSMSSNNNYYFATNYEYDSSTRKYSLVNPFQLGVWKDIYSTLPGKGYYTCMSTSETGTCDQVQYISGTSSSEIYAIYLYGGATIEERNSDLVYGTGYTENNGIYTLTGVSSIKSGEWFTKRKLLEKKYKCGSFKQNKCADLYYIEYTNNESYVHSSIEKEYIYGNSYTYDGKNYHLTDTVQILDGGANSNLLNTHRYTCKSKKETCTTLYYILSMDDSDMSTYNDVSLINGKNAYEAINQMLYSTDINTDSNIKAFIDNWYEENMILYSNYIENTIFCNDRSITSMETWDPTIDKNITTVYRLQFNASQKSSLSCEKNDQFTINDGSGLGNGKLTYPIALITKSEATLMGSELSKIGINYWTMTPAYLDNMISTRFTYVSNYGTTTANYNGTYGVRPSISLKENIEYNSGNGTKTMPYVIDAKPNGNIKEKSAYLYDVIKKDAITNNNIYKGAENYDFSETIYYYKNVEKNNVLFANFCWQMVRTTGTNGVKLIYNGVPTDNKCNNSGDASILSEKSTYNDNNSLSSVGYMFNKEIAEQYPLGRKNYVYEYYYAPDVTYDGSKYILQNSTKMQLNGNNARSSLVNNNYSCLSYSNSCTKVYYIFDVNTNGSSLYSVYYVELTNGKKIKDMLTESLSSENINKDNSTIKNVIDVWYKGNLNEYTKMIENVVYCNDRTFIPKGLNSYSAIGQPYFGSTITNGDSETEKIKLTCPQKEDQFTIDDGSGLGNGTLEYPVGLLTASEMKLITSEFTKSSTSFWGMSPAYISNESKMLYGGSSLSCTKLNNKQGVRPVISLKTKTKYTTGDGTVDNPYIIDISE